MCIGIMSEKTRPFPTHVGIIMDGNGRWAKAHGVPRVMGHNAGMQAMKKIVIASSNMGIKYLTFYAFSTENWKRPPEEVSAIMDLFREYLKELDERKLENEEKGIQVNFIGNKKGLPKDILAAMKYSERITKDKTKVYLNIAVNYGGREEIVHSVRELAKQVKKGKLKPDDITEDMIGEHLYTAGMPDPDLIIRPSGEKRLSNFLLWQAAYAEFWSSDVLWPDFSEENLIEALRNFEKRNRRFGGV